MYLTQERITDHMAHASLWFFHHKDTLATRTLCCIASNGISNHKAKKSNGQVISNSTKSKQACA